MEQDIEFIVTPIISITLPSDAESIASDVPSNLKDDVLDYDVFYEAPKTFDLGNVAEVEEAEEERYEMDLSFPLAEEEPSIDDQLKYIEAGEADEEFLKFPFEGGDDSGQISNNSFNEQNQNQVAANFDNENDFFLNMDHNFSHNNFGAVEDENEATHIVTLPDSQNVDDKNHSPPILSRVNSTSKSSREIRSSNSRAIMTDPAKSTYEHDRKLSSPRGESSDNDDEGLWFKGHTPLPSDESDVDEKEKKEQLDKILSFDHQFALPVISGPITKLFDEKLVHNDLSYGEADFQVHRNEPSYGSTHDSSHKKRKKHHKHHKLKKSSSSLSGIAAGLAGGENKSPEKRGLASGIIPSVLLPQISETKESEVTDVTDKASDLLSPSGETRRKRKHHHHRRHHHRKHHRRTGETDTLESRILTGMQTLEEERRAIRELTAESNMDIREEDIADIQSHRYDNFVGKGLKRQSIRRRISKSSMATHMSTVNQTQQPENKVKEKPHIRINMHEEDQLKFAPREGFVELEELTTNENNEFQWKERARWIKFEEDIEKNERWGKPHVASLSFQSLLEMRRGIEQGTVLLNLENYDLPTIYESVVDNMIITDQIRSEHREKLIAVLLSKHCHQHQRTGNTLARRPSTPSLSRHNSDVANKDSQHDSGQETGKEEDEVDKGDTFFELTEVGEDEKRQRKNGVTNENGQSKPPFIPRQFSVDMPQLSKRRNTPVFTRQHSFNGFENSAVESDTNFLKVPNIKFGPATELGTDDSDVKKPSDIQEKIPEGAEATSVLVATIEELERPAIAFVKLAQGCRLGNLSEVDIPVRFLFLIIGPPSTLDYYEIGRSIATLMSDKIFHDLAYEAKNRDDILSAINSFLDDSIVLAPGDWDRHLLLPLLQAEITEKKKERIKLIKAQASYNQSTEFLFVRTQTPFGGLKRDIHKKAKWYYSDFTDGTDLRCLVTIIFMFFATLAPTITFGALLSKKTEDQLGVMETLIATSLCGIFFSLFAGQPLIIIGSTGPILVFEEATYALCKYFEIDFMVWRLYIGLMVMVIIWLVVALEGCFLVEYFTRFTEEVFSVLISLLFIYEALSFLYKTFKENSLHTSFNITNTTNITLPRDEDDRMCHTQPNIGLISTLLVIGTLFIAQKLRQLRASHFFSSKARRVLSDFGVPISMVLMVTINVLSHCVEDVPKIKMSDSLKPTSKNRTQFFVNPADSSIGPGWIAFAIVPAICVSILLFMETELTGVLLNKKKNKLRKSGGYNLDLFVMGLLTGVSSVLGLPWMCAATVRSVQHQNALAILSRTHAPGERPYLVKIKEQRLTNLLIHVIIGFCIFAEPIISEIPLAVCFGVFMYLGITSLVGIQFIEQIRLIFVPMKYHPNRKYVRCVRFRSLLTYTLIQVFCLLLLIGIKLSPAAPLFPFVIIGMVFLRKLINRFYEPDELHELDNEDDDAEFDDMDEYGISLAL